jgi:hypothetical protein
MKNVMEVNALNAKKKLSINVIVEKKMNRSHAIMKIKKI